MSLLEYYLHTTTPNGALRRLAEIAATAGNTPDQAGARMDLFRLSPVDQAVVDRLLTGDR